MKETSGTGELTVKSQLNAGDQLLISVSDTGAGLPTDRADKIFDAFFTTKPQGVWDFRSVGLSLSRTAATCGPPPTLGGSNLPVHAAEQYKGCCLNYDGLVPATATATKRQIRECLTASHPVLPRNTNSAPVDSGLD